VTHRSAWLNGFGMEIGEETARVEFEDEDGFNALALAAADLGNFDLFAAARASAAAAAAARADIAPALLSVCLMASSVTLPVTAGGAFDKDEGQA
jgi:hypothetical protein